MSLITTETIAMRRGGRDLIALDRLELAAGSFTVILGPNGAGKTSLLRLLSGETAPDRGRITFDGSDLAQWTPGALALRRAVMVQEQHLDFPLRVVDVAGLGSLARKGRGQASRDEIGLVARALAEVGADHLAERWCPSLSGGEQQRVHLARALVQVADPVGPDGPNALMLDEPTASLDIAHQIDALEIASRFAGQGGMSLAILHDPLLARAHADRLIFIAAGRLIGDIEAGSPRFDELCATTYGARFDTEQRAWARL